MKCAFVLCVIPHFHLQAQNPRWSLG